MKINPTNPIFHDEDAAREWLESLRWPDGPICPHCGSLGTTRLDGFKHRPGCCQCNDCRKQFTVTVGTVFERSRIPLTKWLVAVWMLSSAKKGVSAHQVHRQLGVTYKTAWFMCHRIRAGMKPDLSRTIGGEGKVVEADEMFVRNGKKAKDKPGKGHGPLGTNEGVFAVVERGGPIRTVHMKREDWKDLRSLLWRYADKASTLYTDQSLLYRGAGKHYADHQTLHHRKGEFQRGKVHTNTVEGYFGIFKRGLVGVYQHMGSQHLHRYLTEFEFRYNARDITDAERTAMALLSIGGKRLEYKELVGKANG